MAGNSTLRFELHGTPQLEARLRSLRDNVADRVVVKAIRKAGEPIVVAAARNARRTDAKMGKRLGGLSKSMGIVVRNYRATHKVLGIIGPLHGKVYKRLGKKEVPALIAHLVEFGHRIAVGGTLAPLAGSKRRSSRSKQTRIAGGGVGRGFVQAQPFLRPAWDAERSAAQATLEAELRAGIESEASR